MFDNQFEKIKGLIKKEGEQNNKKKIESLVVFLIILIITILAINTIWNEDKKENTVDDRI